MKVHNLGFPRIGIRRELKFATEKYWKNEIDAKTLASVAAELRKANLVLQSELDLVPVGDFSLYDHVLDTSFLLGNIPERAANGGSELDQYFRVARGRTRGDDDGAAIEAGEMTKWFNTNYHYIVPEFSSETGFELRADTLLAQIEEARALGCQVKPVLIGPLTYLWLGKSTVAGDKLDLLDRLLPVYAELFNLLDRRGVEWIQVDEPILVTDIDSRWHSAFLRSYAYFSGKPRPKLLLTSYFGSLGDNLSLACQLNVDGIHLDASINTDEANKARKLLSPESVLSLGVVNGRNIWKSDLEKTLSWLTPLAADLGARLWIAPTCSLLHVPIDLEKESDLDSELLDWLAFAVQKLNELKVLGTAINLGREAVALDLKENQRSILARGRSNRVHDRAVQGRVSEVTEKDSQRKSGFETRQRLQQKRLQLPLFPTTTIGSFPQTSGIRQCRRQLKKGEITESSYREIMRDEIANCIRKQEELDLDVLVHGEPERNDMVEYFGEQLSGFAFSVNGWVQSYGSRCVKPPIIFGDVSRPQPITIDWANYAQSLTEKPVKGMLTGPVTLLNWSFVRDDLPREAICTQLSLAIRDEVSDLENAGIQFIQIDEPALREGLPLRKSAWQSYLAWATTCFRLSANHVSDETQIHTHMCYSEFNDIIRAISEMDADVVTIETSRSKMELLQAFADFEYPNQIGPGIYDIHSPNTPTVEDMEKLICRAAEYLPRERLWINPDCGLKTRRWEEVIPALKNMVKVAQSLREQFGVVGATDGTSPFHR